MNRPPLSSTAIRSRWQGALLIGVTLLSVVAMGHHPTLLGSDPAETVERALRIAALSHAVHGVLIAVMLLQLVLLAELSRRRGVEGGFERAAVLLWTVGTMALIGAALISGFVAPDLAALAVPGGRMSPQLAVQLMRFGHVCNQALATSGTLVLAAAMAAWSWPLALRPGWARVVGVGGLLAALLIGIGLLSGLVQLDVHGMLAAVLLLGAWMVGVGVLGWRGG